MRSTPGTRLWAAPDGCWRANSPAPLGGPRTVAWATNLIHRVHRVDEVVIRLSRWGTPRPDQIDGPRFVRGIQFRPDQADDLAERAPPRRHLDMGSAQPSRTAGAGPAEISIPTASSLDRRRTVRFQSDIRSGAEADGWAQRERLRDVPAGQASRQCAPGAGFAEGSALTVSSAAARVRRDAVLHPDHDAVARDRPPIPSRPSRGSR